MGIFANLTTGLHSLLSGRRVEREMDEELRSFLHASTEDKRRAGMTPDQAALAARIEMGSTNAVKHRIRSAGWETAAENLWQDLRYSVRMLAKSPVFTLVAVGSLALGIGANTAIFSLMDVVMLRSLPVADPGQLVLFGTGSQVGSTGSLPNSDSELFSYPFYRSFSQKNDVFSGVAAIDSVEFATHASLAGQGREMTHVYLVSGTYFSVLGVNPERGRVLTGADDNVPGSGAVAVASYSWWQRHGSDPAMLGKTNQKLVARLSAFFGLLAAFLVCIGIYGLLSYAVARRTSEIGVRMALGARRSGVLWLILREILVLVAIGVAIGIPLALGGNKLVVRLLYGLTPADPASLLAAIAMLVVIAVLAGYLPARRASLVEPTVALRCE